jgi:cell wall-associated NlpC family hydrolase
MRSDPRRAVPDFPRLRGDRGRLVAEAESWIGTPYRAAQRVKGRDGGVDCLTFVVEVFERAGVIPHYVVPYYPQDWHLHRDDERYLAGVLDYAREIAGPPAPGDLVLFRFGRCFAHGGIVSAWPMMIHAWNGVGVVPVDVTQALLGGRTRRFFDPFSRERVKELRAQRSNLDGIASSPSAPRNDATRR